MERKMSKTPASGAWGSPGEKAPSMKAVPADRQIASFVARASYDDLSKDAKAAMKRTVLDTVACAIAALGGDPARMLREQFREYTFRMTACIESRQTVNQCIQAWNSREAGRLGKVAKLKPFVQSAIF